LSSLAVYFDFDFIMVNSFEKNKPEDGAASVHTQGRNSDSDTEAISSNVQHGIQAIEATTSVWSKSSLITAYALYVVDRASCINRPNHFPEYGRLPSSMLCSKA
jgi:hypothetical protein